LIQGGRTRKDTRRNSTLEVDLEEVTLNSTGTSAVAMGRSSAATPSAFAGSLLLGVLLPLLALISSAAA
jgi:hypothetical protein